MRVRILAPGTSEKDRTVVSVVGQRDLYRKYGWPAKDRIQAAVRKFVKSTQNC